MRVIESILAAVLVVDSHGGAFAQDNPILTAGPLRFVELFLLPLEVGLVAVVGTRAYRALGLPRSNRKAPDPVEQFRDAAAALVKSPRVADMIGTEVACLYFALMSWRSKPSIPIGAVAFRAHEKTGNAGLVLAAVLLVFAEIIPIHILVAQWSLLAAWILTVLSAYGLLLLVGDYRATVLRPILIDGTILNLRAGLRWNVEIPISQINSLSMSNDGHDGGSLDLTIIGSATHWLVLSEAVEVRGMYGIRRTVVRIGIQPDDQVDRRGKATPFINLFCFMAQSALGQAFDLNPAHAFDGAIGRHSRTIRCTVHRGLSDG